MADTALFSSFHRPRTPVGEPIDDLPTQAPTRIREPDPAPANCRQAPRRTVRIWTSPANQNSKVCKRRLRPNSTKLATSRTYRDPTGSTSRRSRSIVTNSAWQTHRHLGCCPVARLPTHRTRCRDIRHLPSSRLPGGAMERFRYHQASDVLTGVAAGTRILTARGEVEVEKLMPGDAALTLRSPALLPISWIGRSVAAARPIRIEPGALGPNVPRRSLCLGPDQAIFIKPDPWRHARWSTARLSGRSTQTRRTCSMSTSAGLKSSLQKVFRCPVAAV